jgi:hypothetical protein
MRCITLFAMFGLFCLLGCRVQDVSVLKEFQSYIKSNDRYKDLTLAKLEYPRSARTKKHSKEAGLGPEWEYVLMGKVESEIDFRTLFEAVYRMNLQDKISIEVQVGEPGKADKSITCSVVVRLDKDAGKEKFSIQSKFVSITEYNRNEICVSREEEMEMWNFPPIAIVGNSATEKIGTSNAWAAVNITRLSADDIGTTTDVYRIEFTGLYDSEVYFEAATNMMLEAGSPFEVRAERSQAEPNRATP